MTFTEILKLVGAVLAILAVIGSPFVIYGRLKATLDHVKERLDAIEEGLENYGLRINSSQHSAGVAEVWADVGRKKAEAALGHLDREIRPRLAALETAMAKLEGGLEKELQHINTSIQSLVTEVRDMREKKSDVPR